MSEAQPTVTGSPAHAGAYLVVTRTPDGRFAVAYTDGNISRRSFASSVEQVIRQAQRAGGIPVHTEDEVLRQRCQDAALGLI